MGQLPQFQLWQRLVWQFSLVLLLIIFNTSQATSQEKRAKIRISNAGLTITALPLLAARDWGIFSGGGLDVEIIVMGPSIAAAALSQGDIDYVAGVGPASVSATLSGLPSRAIWFSSDRIAYWLVARPQIKRLEELKGKKIAVSGGLGGTNHVALLIALEKSGANPKDFGMVRFPASRFNFFTRWSQDSLMPPLLLRRSRLTPTKRALKNYWMSARWWRCPAVA